MANNASVAPIKFQQLLHLVQIGINKNAIKFHNISIGSHHVAITQDNKIIMIHIATRTITPLNIAADSAIIHPSTNVLALRSNNNLQIFNLDFKKQTKSAESADQILFWKWLNRHTIAYVTRKAAYHWSIDTDSKPQKAFDFTEERQVQIIGYDASADGNWLFVQAIAKPAKSDDYSIEGVLLLYNVPLKRYQPKMNAYGACFAYLNVNGRDATLFCFAKKDNQSTKLFIVEIGNNNNPLRVQSEIPFESQNDWIVSMVPSAKYGCIYSISIYGTVFLYDIQSAKCIFSRKVSNTGILLGVPHTETNGIITLNRGGIMALFHVDKDNYVSYITNTVGDAKLGVTIATRYNLSGADNIFKSRFEQLQSAGQYQQACKLAAAAPQGVLGGTSNIGLSSGGAKDIHHFRQCIANNKIPPIASITYNGVLSEYYFDTHTRASLKYMNDNERKEDANDASMLFYPTYCYAKVKRLNDDECKESDEFEYYMSVGLNSNIKMNEFKRKHLNLVIVLDQSGSMSAALDGNNFGYNYDETKTKMHVANQAVIALLTHLYKGDRFGLITFNQSTQTIQSLDLIQNINTNELNETILNIKHGGGTNLEQGYNAAIAMYMNMEYDAAYENRVMFVTDAQPNIGHTDSNTLLDLISLNALNENKRIYSTVIGVGLDFNSRLVQQITQTRGCNYFTVNSKTEFMNTMDEEFDYMVTPLVFDVVLTLKCEGNVCQIDKVYGSDEMVKTGEIIRMDTLFAAKRRSEEKGGGVKGGIQIIKLKKRGDSEEQNMNVEIEVSYEDRNGKRYKNEQMVALVSPPQQHNYKNDMIETDDNDDDAHNFYDNLGIRKGILLCKYVELITAWIENRSVSDNQLMINTKYKKLFIAFEKHFKKEMKMCGDEALQKEVDLMQILINLAV
eukprot:241717_1